MIPTQIINRGRGPELAGTRFTVYDIIPYLQKGRIPAYIAAVTGLAQEQVEALIQYINDHKEEVMAENAKIDARAARGNTPEVKAILEKAHATQRNF